MTSSPRLVFSFEGFFLLRFEACSKTPSCGLRQSDGFPPFLRGNCYKIWNHQTPERVPLFIFILAVASSHHNSPCSLFPESTGFIYILCSPTVSSPALYTPAPASILTTPLPRWRRHSSWWSARWWRMASATYTDATTGQL
ncbi:hypothetical protein GCK32_017350 [Trichostrongylus colubriformis]|uniref:Uncharacterized protein n=1 Tax=Trichostrongylus colubriformis TaxID=6319 RepID=A0AAN8F648_TRICO